MPRSTPERITARPVVDPSQGGGVGLTVQASLPRSNGAMWGVAQALQGLQGDVNQQLRRTEAQRREEAEDAARAQKKQDEKDGKAKADEASVTGTVDTKWLETASDDARRSYQQVDGANAVNRFENNLAPKLARLEPGENIDDFLQNEANSWLEENNLPEESRKSFMIGAQPMLQQAKAAYLKQSIGESFKRQEEGFSALLNGNLQSGAISTPEQYAQWRQAAALHGLHDEEIDHMAVEAVSSALASGKVDIPRTLSLLKAQGPGGVALADHPDYSESLRVAADKGEQEQKQQRAKAMFDAKVVMLDTANSLADKGMLTRAKVTAWAKEYDQSPEWAASMLDKARTAREKAAKEAAEDQEKRDARAAFASGDPLHVEKVGADKVKAAGEDMFQELIADGVKNNDLSKVPAFISMAAANNATFPAYGRVMSGFADTSNPDRFDFGYRLYKQTQNTAPGWAEANMDAKTLALYRSYDRRTTIYHDSPQQALGALTAAKEVDPAIREKQVNAVMKKLPNALPKDFGDSNWLSFSPHGATKIANAAEFQSGVLDYARDAIEQGQFFNDPDGAIEFGIAKYKADHVRVGDRYERSYGSVAGEHQAAQVGKAMTALSEAKKAQLVAAKVIDPEDTIGFAPTPNAPNRWQLWLLHAGVRRPLTEEVTVTGDDGQPRKETRLIQATASDVAAKHRAWTEQEAARDAETEQGYRKFGIGAKPGDTKDANEYLNQITYNQAGDLGTFNHMGSPTPVAEALNTPKGRDAAKAFVNDPARQKQSFIDFLNSTK